MNSITEILTAANALIPVITLNDAADAEPLADVLADNGFKVLEITLRTPAALDAIRLLSRSRPDLIVGAGTVYTAEQVAAASAAGARFLVSPGFADGVHVAADSLNLPYLPGVATVTEAMAAAQRGYAALKLFPANVAGGPTMLKALHTVLPAVTFCPTGGVSEATLFDYLRQPNVACVGGSWLASATQISQHQWDEIGALASSAGAMIEQIRSSG